MMATYKFSEIAYNITDKKMPVPEDRDTYIGLEHMDTGSLSIRRYGSEVVITGEKLAMKKGDILFGRRNAYLKRAAIAPHDGLFSAHGMILRPKIEIVNEKFFPFFIASDYFMDAAIRISVGSLSPTVNWGTLKDVEFNLPDIKEQEKLAELLWAANDTKEAYKKLLSLTDDLVKSKFVEMFGLPNDNVKSFNKGTIRDIASEVKYGTSKPATDGGRYPYLRMNNITYGGQLDLSDLKYIDISDTELEKCVVRKGDVLFNRTNSKELVGKTCVFNIDKPMVIAGYIIRVIMNGKVLPEYLSTFLNLKYGKDLLFNMCKAAIGQANINAQELQNIEIILAPMNLQLEFLELMRQTDKSKSELQQTITSLENTIKSLMQQYTG